MDINVMIGALGLGRLEFKKEDEGYYIIIFRPNNSLQIKKTAGRTPEEAFRQLWQEI